MVVLAVLGAPGAAASPGGPVTRCVLDDPRVDEASGLASTPDGPVVVDDSGHATVIRTLAPDCSVAASRAVDVPGHDVEDLARGGDGTLWVADIGDNDRDRTGIALIRVPVRGPAGVRRLAYPDGPHDAETLLMPADGRPVIVTKDLGGRSGVYTTDSPPTGSSPTPLRRVGELAVPPSSTGGGPVGPFGRGLLTGGALSADGRVAAVRTYTDAWLYPVAGDAAGTADGVVAALRGTPVDVPLPDEPQGEAIAFTADGTLLSAGETGRSAGGVSEKGALRALPGAAGLVAARPRPAPDPASTAPAGAAPPSGNEASARGTTTEAGAGRGAPVAMVVGVVVPGLVVVGLGVVGLGVAASVVVARRARGRR